MDAFFASVEIREDPSLRDKPVIVGGSPKSRAVVCSANYIARKYGIRSAMPCSFAERLCPEAIFLPPRFQLYQEVSSQIFSIFWEYTDQVETLALDEAYLDVTVNKKGIPYAVKIAEEIRNKVKKQTSLTVSCGVSFNKFLAKVASDWKKPDGLFVIRPEDAETFLDDLSIGKFYGIGSVTERKMKALGIFKGRDLKKKSLEELERHFGKMGIYFHQLARGIDYRPVVSSRERKSLGIEDTFEKDTDNHSELGEYLHVLVRGLYERMISKGITGRSLTIKIKDTDFRTRSATETTSYYLKKEEEIRCLAFALLKKLWRGEKLRLIGLSLSNLCRNSDDRQLLLFP